MRAAVKRLVDASVAVQNIIVDAAQRDEKLTEKEMAKICQLMNGARMKDQFVSDEERTVFYVLNFLKKENLTKGSNSLAATFDPVDVVEAYEDQLLDHEFDALLDYANKVRVAYWNF